MTFSQELQVGIEEAAQLQRMSILLLKQAIRDGLYEEVSDVEIVHHFLSLLWPEATPEENLVTLGNYMYSLQKRNGNHERRTRTIEAESATE